LADDPEGGLLDEEEQVEVTPIYRPMLELTNASNMSAVLVRRSALLLRILLTLPLSERTTTTGTERTQARLDY
jgi:hypothetical protein